MNGNLRPCGTRAAYKRHHRNGEPPCAECREAEAAARRPGREPRFRLPVKPPVVRDPVVPYRYRARTYPWAVRVLERSEAVHGSPEEDAA